jgi:hypothetical protein
MLVSFSTYLVACEKEPVTDLQTRRGLDFWFVGAGGRFWAPECERRADNGTCWALEVVN